MLDMKKIWLNWQSKRWQKRMLEIVCRLYGAEKSQFEIPDGRMLEISTIPMNNGKMDSFVNEKFIITLDEKPVFEALLYRKFIYTSDKYEIIRFNYGQWVNIIWDIYTKDKTVKRKQEEITQLALFEPLDK